MTQSSTGKQSLLVSRFGSWEVQQQRQTKQTEIRQRQKVGTQVVSQRRQKNPAGSRQRRGPMFYKKHHVCCVVYTSDSPMHGTLSIIQFRRIHFLAQKTSVWWSFLLNLSVMDQSNIPSSKYRGSLFLILERILLISCPVTCQNCCTFVHCHRQCVRLPVSILHLMHSGDALGLKLWCWDGDMWACCSWSFMALTQLHTQCFCILSHIVPAIICYLIIEFSLL